MLKMEVFLKILRVDAARTGFCVFGGSLRGRLLVARGGRLALRGCTALPRAVQLRRPQCRQRLGSLELGIQAII